MRFECRHCGGKSYCGRQGMMNTVVKTVEKIQNQYELPE